MAGGYTSHTYYCGDDEHMAKQGYISVIKEEYNLLKGNGFISPYNHLDSKYVDLATSFLRKHNHPHYNEIDKKSGHTDLLIN